MINDSEERNSNCTIIFSNHATSIFVNFASLWKIKLGSGTSGYWFPAPYIACFRQPIAGSVDAHFVYVWLIRVCGYELLCYILLGKHIRCRSIHTISEIMSHSCLIPFIITWSFHSAQRRQPEKPAQEVDQSMTLFPSTCFQYIIATPDLWCQNFSLGSELFLLATDMDCSWIV